MSSSDDPRLCYAKDADDPLRYHYFDVSEAEFRSPGASDLLIRSLASPFPRKHEILEAVFTTPIEKRQRTDDHWKGLTVTQLYDIRHRGRPNEYDLFDVLFMPSFNKPALLLSIAVDGDRVHKLDWRVYTAREFSAIDVDLYQQRFRILVDDLAAIRLSMIEIMRDRLGAERFDEWLRKTRFVNQTPGPEAVEAVSEPHRKSPMQDFAAWEA